MDGNAAEENAREEYELLRQRNPNVDDKVNPWYQCYYLVDGESDY